MKSIVDYITEKVEESDAKVYVVKDKQDGSIVNVADSEDTVVITGDFGLLWNYNQTKSEKHWIDWLYSKPYNVFVVPFSWSVIN